MCARSAHRARRAPPLRPPPLHRRAAQWDGATAPRSGGLGVWVHPIASTRAQNCAFDAYRYPVNSTYQTYGKPVPTFSWYYNSFVGVRSGAFQMWHSGYDDKLRTAVGTRRRGRGDRAGAAACAVRRPASRSLTFPRAWARPTPSRARSVGPRARRLL